MAEVDHAARARRARERKETVRSRITMEVVGAVAALALALPAAAQQAAVPAARESSGPGAPAAAGRQASAVVATAPAAPLLTLEAALARADGAAYANRVAAGRAEEEGARPVAALQGILPTLRFEAGYMRTTDPIGAFGVALRQRRIEQADFDPARLNDPAATTNHTAGVVVEQPVLNADAHIGRLAAGHAAAAGAASERWTRLGTRVDVVRAYYGAVLAAEQVATLEAAAGAAHAHVRQADALVANGLATRSDALLASVKAGEVDAKLVGARGDARLARSQLALVMGAPGDVAFALPARLPTPAAIRALVAASPAGPSAADLEAAAGGGAVPAGPSGPASDAALPASAAASAAALAGVEGRADVVAAREALAAARLDVRRAESLLLPRVNAFARYDWNAAGWSWGEKRNWTVGVMASWSPFAGASQVAEVRAAAGRRAAARAGAEEAAAGGRLEAERAENAREVALARLAIAERAAAQSAEAHRIVTKKYEGGLATVLELLDAAAVETRASLALSGARYDAIVAEAERLRDTGQDPAVLSRLDTLDDGTER